MTRLIPGLVRERLSPLPLILRCGRCASTWSIRRRTGPVLTGGTAASRTARWQRPSSGSSSSRSQGTPDHEEKGDVVRRTVIDQARPAEAIGGRHQGTESRRKTGVDPLPETEMIGEAKGTEIALRLAGVDPAGKESGFSERLGLREPI